MAIWLNFFILHIRKLRLGEKNNAWSRSIEWVRKAARMWSTVSLPILQPAVIEKPTDVPVSWMGTQTPQATWHSHCPKELIFRRSQGLSRQPHHRRKWGKVESFEKRRAHVQKKFIQVPFLYSVLTTHTTSESKIWPCGHWGISCEPLVCLKRQTSKKVHVRRSTPLRVSQSPCHGNH